MSKKLETLLKNLSSNNAYPSATINAITNDSRTVSKNTLFLAYPGAKSDGRAYIQQAIEKGACAICYEPNDFVLSKIIIPAIPIPDLKTKQSLIAARFYDFPSKKIPIIGVTGTNGKTSVTYFIAALLQKMHCAIIGTTGYGFPPNLHKLINTTPDGVQLQKIFFELIAQDAKAIAMEVSSHALDQGRSNDIQFHTAVFTNLTQDHLDYHETMEKYRDAKELLFQQDGLKNAVINIDDEAGKYFAKKYRNKLNVITYSANKVTTVRECADIFLISKQTTAHGFDLKIKLHSKIMDFHLPMIGEFNIENILAAIGAVSTIENADTTITASKDFLTVPGRMQLFQQGNSPTVVVDFAHTPDALEKALKSIRTHCKGKLCCVFGCGGDRDKTKRPKMGKIADDWADNVIITNDNPRNEDPMLIAKEVLSGAAHQNKFDIILDRHAAIQHAIQQSKKNDWILVAGKGHETEQIIGNEKLHHDDAASVKALLTRYCTSF
ncbi:MAG: UDP-N-acetylmuramoyl-L-alanyl-D-glutamate--2,6-diaminopimelate ligase [Gammaproteobacteria bacterium RIFCSPHIGHO2_12_FULL_42_13]|nr:MAG: UDP-N-acetylmuramoyl-L-alanyl-D-glutamate--2,6-diaminopimelate ligase [Gammaproteobacteria bacterium RIFCSPHIGHO2_12_FULL_42_13]